MKGLKAGTKCKRMGKRQENKGVKERVRGRNMEVKKWIRGRHKEERNG